MKGDLSMSKMENCVAATDNKYDHERKIDMYNARIANALAYVTEKDSQLTIDEFEKLLGIHFTTKHTGKMEGMASLSTACICNERCIARHKIEGSVCEKCFAERMFRRYGQAFEDCFVRNSEILTSVVIPYELMPVLNYCIFRYESLGDVANEIQAENYRRLAVMNPYVTFGWWTKNYDIVEKVFNKNGKPNNVMLIMSSYMLNEQFKLEDYPYADKIFTVYTKEYAEENNIEINCGGNKCLTCQECYRFGMVDYINEIKK